MDGKINNILMADDDAEDRELAMEALRLADVTNPIVFVKDGVELMDYLRHTAQYAEAGSSPVPALILLDLNMPRMDGHAALREIKADRILSKIPIVVLTTSKNIDDVEETYRLGAQSYMVKPTSFLDFVAKLRTVASYWFETVELPEEKR